MGLAFLRRMWCLPPTPPHPSPQPRSGEGRFIEKALWGVIFEVEAHFAPTAAALWTPKLAKFVHQALQG